MEVVTRRKVDFLRNISNILKSMEASTNDRVTPKNKVYGVNSKNGRIFFDNKKDLKKYVKENSLTMNDTFKVEYMGDYAKNDDVIRVIDGDNVFVYKEIDEYTCLKFDRAKSLKLGEPIWEFGYKDVTSYYKALGRYKRSS